MLVPAEEPPRARDIIQAIVKLELAPALKAEGFKKSGLTFTRRRGLTTQTIQFELSSWNRGPRGSFDVRVGVAFDEMRQPDEPPSSHPEFHGVLRQLLPDVPSFLEVDADIPLPLASARLTQWIMDGVVARLNRVNALADFESTGWAKVQPWRFPALLAYHLGRDEEAARLIDEEAEYFKDRGLTREDLIEWLRLHRLKRE